MSVFHACNKNIHQIVLLITLMRVKEMCWSSSSICLKTHKASYLSKSWHRISWSRIQHHVHQTRAVGIGKASVILADMLILFRSKGRLRPLHYHSLPWISKPFYSPNYILFFVYNREDHLFCLAITLLKANICQTFKHIKKQILRL